MFVCLLALLWARTSGSWGSSARVVYNEPWHTEPLDTKDWAADGPAYQCQPTGPLSWVSLLMSGWSLMMNLMCAVLSQSWQGHGQITLWTRQSDGWCSCLFWDFKDSHVMAKNTETLKEQRAWWRLEAMDTAMTHYWRTGHLLFYARIPCLKDPKV